MVQEFCLSCKNLDDQERLGKSKTVDSEAVLQSCNIFSFSDFWRRIDFYGNTIICFVFIS